MAMTTIMGALELGLILALMSVGMFISFRILNIPDLTVDGSFTLGSAFAATFAVQGQSGTGVLLAVVAGALAGAVTGLLQTKLKIQPILSGILTMTALYSVNLWVMGNKPNLSFFGKDTLFTPFERFLPELAAKIVPILLLLAIVTILIRLFLGTQLGLSLRATGDNEDMVRASSINSDAMKILGLSLSNAIVSLAGAVMAQYQVYADISGGIGMMVIGLASIIVGQALLGQKGGVTRGFVAGITGAVVYRFILTFALQSGMASNDLKILSAALVVIAISIPEVKKFIQKRRARRHA